MATGLLYLMITTASPVLSTFATIELREAFAVASPTFSACSTPRAAGVIGTSKVMGYHQ
ncbi:hypothetical protein [uncultured Parolsenella sp.]|uniref:hypothetical protein n=1 Tax=uncultured Parolsenella sp. TaxID=2083008 RepID=UPI0027D987B8|nr:hypothetical protein [uncultured Parolsenella sp.]